MDKTEAQGRAIKLTAADQKGLGGSHMDAEGQVHKCPNCGHEMPMDEVLGQAGGIKLASGQKGGTHMDREGNLG